MFMFTRKNPVVLLTERILSKLLNEGEYQRTNETRPAL